MSDALFNPISQKVKQVISDVVEGRIGLPDRKRQNYRVV